MDKIYDFSGDRMINRPLGGTDRKYPIMHQGTAYMIKYPDQHEKKGDVSTSHLNSITSEYISSHISASTGLITHETLLGYRDGNPVVACRDFREDYDSNIEFGEYVRAVYDSDEIGRVLRLDQIYSTLEKAESIPEDLKQKAIERYWDTFVIDALVGNFDRHKGNWGFLSGPKGLRLAPVYDYGSTLLPTLSDKGMKEWVNDREKMFERCLVFPSPALFIGNEKHGKPGYYDLLSSGYDAGCTKALLRMAPKIDMDRIGHIIDETPMISDIKKAFYKKYIALRKALIIDRAYDRCLTKNFDMDALERIKTGEQYSTDMLKKDIRAGKFENIPFPETRAENSMYVIAGIPGAGKHIVAESYIYEHPHAEYIRTNDIRSEIAICRGDNTEMEERGLISGNVFENAYHKLEEALKDAKDVVFVAGNLDRRSRKKLLSIADSIPGVQKHLEVIYADPEKVSSPEPLKVLRDKAVKLHLNQPDMSEGWDSVKISGQDPYIGKDIAEETVSDAGNDKVKEPQEEDWDDNR